MAFALTQGTALGAPNIYRAADEMRRTLGAERMDICAFVGIAPRGPCRVPIEPESCQVARAFVAEDQPRYRSVAVPVSSWDDYQRLYGGFEGPGRLPYAVASFFEQGGRRAYIVRIVHDYADKDDLKAVARATIPGLLSSGADPTLVAKNEGAWGNQLKAALGYHTQPLMMVAEPTTVELYIGTDENHPVGTLLRLTVPVLDHVGDPVPNATPSYEFRFIERCEQRGLQNDEGAQQYILLNQSLTAPPIEVEVVEAQLLIEDGQGVLEQIDNVGLSASHPRWLATVIYQESELVNPEQSWLDVTLTPEDVYQVPRQGRRVLREAPILFSEGYDRYESIEHADFFDQRWVVGNTQPGAGIHALTQLYDLSLLVIPDLYVPEALAKSQIPEEVSLASANFEPCVDVLATTTSMQQLEHSLPGLLLNPLNNNDLTQIVSLQKQVIALAAVLRRFIVLLDVPPGINHQAIISWRAHFGSDFSAAYFPWLCMSSLDDNRDSLILINPSAVAAGIIARQEQTFGVPHGPANAIAHSVVSVKERISPQRHDQLHPVGINIFLPRRNGIWLSAARTLSRHQDYRQLSVRRLITMLQRVLLRQMQWLVFEPNHHPLWAQVRHLLINFLRQLYRVGAFKGSSEEQAFFVRCDAELNNSRVVDAGQLIVEIGVAPAEPLEFIVVRIVRDGDGTLAVES